jgi:2-hydroxy-3-oxopropionate reductase
METVGVIGLGVMGGPMAANLSAGGFDVVGYNRSPAAVHALAARGGRAAGSIADVTQQSDVVITMLPDSPDVESVVLGDDGVLAHAREGLVFIDCSTIRPDVSRTIGELARSAGVRPLDAPVSGGERGAKEASLSIMVGGRAEDFQRAAPVLSAVGKTIVHVGPDGAGQTVKAANQLIVAGNIALVAEAIVLLEASGVDPGPALTVLQGGLAGSRVLDLKGPTMLARDFTPGFRTELHHKDLGIALAAARDAAVALPVTGLVSQLVASVCARGMGSLDHGALLTLVEALAGRDSAG